MQTKRAGQHHQPQDATLVQNPRREHHHLQRSALIRSRLEYLLLPHRKFRLYVHELYVLGRGGRDGCEWRRLRDRINRDNDAKSANHVELRATEF